MAHTLTTYFLLSHFHTATVADDAFISDSLLFTTMTFPILHRTEDSLTEQTTHFRLIRSIIYGLWLGYFTIGTVQNRFWGGQADGNSGEIVVEFFIFSKRHNFLRYDQGGYPPLEPN